MGIDELVARGRLDHLRGGPLYWLGMADSQPCIGTGGICAWELTAYGGRLPGGPLPAWARACRTGE